MRSEQQILEKIISIAKEDDRIRAVILNGSRTNPEVVKDDFQDFDVIYLVKNLESFGIYLNWIDVFGERIIVQMPNSMEIDEGDIESTDEIVYLMLFKDFHRIDLRLVKMENIKDCKDSLNKVLLDKDNLFSDILKPTDADYILRKPSQKAFADCCNEFWWVSTYVVKGLARNELIYAKEMLEGPVRKMFMKMMAWSAGTDHDFTINVGKSHRYLKSYLSPSVWSGIIKTYPRLNKIEIWQSLMEMTKLFDDKAAEVADRIGLTYNHVEAENVKAYLNEMKRAVFE